MTNMTVNAYIETIKTMGDVMGLAQQLKKMDVENIFLENIIQKARIKLMEVNRKDYDRYVEYVGCHSGIDADYGCMKYTVNANHGGTVKISDWIDVDGSGGSLASIHISNGWGLGTSNYINNLKDIEKQVEGAKRITWINETERTFLINSLENLKRGIK